MESPEVRQALAGKYVRRMLYGIFMTIVGIVLTGLTYVAPDKIPEIGTYLFTWGIVLFGIITFSEGLFRWRKYRI